MQDVLTLQDLPMGQMGEIVDLSEEHKQAIYQEFGASVGMTVMILHKAWTGWCRLATVRWIWAANICSISKCGQ